MKKTVCIFAVIVFAICFAGCDRSAPDAVGTDSLPETAPVTDAPVTDAPLTELGGSTACIHTLMYGEDELDTSYHSIDSTLIQYVGADRFNEWIAQREAEKTVGGECPYAHITIVRFVEDFQIPRDVFAFLCDNALNLQYDYNLDAIYAGEEAAARYYTGDRLQTILEKRLIRLFKSKLLEYARTRDAAAVTAWIEATNRTEWGFSKATRSHTELPGYGFTDEFRGNLNQVSCRTLISAFDIPRAAAEEMLHEACAAYAGCARSMDLDALYSAAMEDATQSGQTPYENDMTFLRSKT